VYAVPFRARMAGVGDTPNVGFTPNLALRLKMLRREANSLPLAESPPAKARSEAWAVLSSAWIKRFPGRFYDLPNDPFWFPVATLLCLSTLLQALYLIALPISFEGDAGGYYAYARWIAGLEPSWFMHWRPPGFPFYLHVLGMTWLDTFNGVLAMNALMGVAMPLLIYGTLRPIGSRWAFVAALILTVSTIPFSYAKVLLPEQPYSFFVILIAFAFSRFVVTRKSQYVVLTACAAFAALSMRNETIYLAALIALIQFGIALLGRQKAAAIYVCICAFVTLVLLGGWSWERSRILHQPELFGSLHNFTGRQLFWRVYASFSGIAGAFELATPASDSDRWSSDGRLITFVQGKNGPASAELAARFPQALANPTDDMGWLIGQEIAQEKGALEADKFFRSVVEETIGAHPELLALFVLTSSQYFGIWIDRRTHGLPLFSVWAFDHYESMPYNIADSAKASLTPHLFKAYTDSQWEFADVSASLAKPPWQQANRPDWLNTFHRVGQTMFNIVRNAVGAVLIFTIWFLPFTRHRALAVFVFLSCGLLLLSAAAGFGFNGRYEHFILPYLLMLAALSTQACLEILRRGLKVAAAAVQFEPVPINGAAASRGLPRRGIEGKVELARFPPR
jgi:hypothetical protein